MKNLASTFKFQEQSTVVDYVYNHHLVTARFIEEKDDYRIKCVHTGTLYVEDPDTEEFLFDSKNSDEIDSYIRTHPYHLLEESDEDEIIGEWAILYDMAYEDIADVGVDLDDSYM